MTLRTLAADLSPERASATAATWLELSKPRLVALVLVTTIAGFTMGSSTSLAYLVLLHTLLGTALAAAGSLALNQVMEREADSMMERTRTRPIPGGRVQPAEALAFGAVTVTAGLVYLALAVNPLSALVTAGIVVSYLFAYTPLKRRSALCTVVGAVPGALPPVAGWVAATGELGLGAAVLFGIMFFWQLPHSLAIAWMYRDDYKKAGIKLLSTIEEDGRSTSRHILLNSMALMAVGLLPSLVGMAGGVYFVVALAMGGWMLWSSIRLAVKPATMAGARRILMLSFLYVPVVLLAMTLDRIALP